MERVHSPVDLLESVAMTQTAVIPELRAPDTISLRGVDINEVTSPELTSYLITSSKRGAAVCC